MQLSRYCSTCRDACNVWAMACENQNRDLKTMRLEEASRQFKVHEFRLQERNSRDEEQAFLSRAFNISKKDQRGSYTSGRGQGWKGKGKDYGGEANGEKKKKQSDKSKVKCYNCEKVGNFGDECELPKRDKSKGKEKMHVAQKDEDEESSFLMVLADEHADVLLQGMNGSPIDDMWYLDRGASSHMTGIKTFYQSLDESHKGVVRFTDGSLIMYEVKGEVHVDCTCGERMIFENILYTPKLKTKILSL